MVIWCDAGRLLPEVTSGEQASRFMMYFLDSVVSKLPKNLDNVLFIYDVKDVGYKNFSKEVGLALIKTASRVFIGTVYKQVVMNSGYTVRMIWGMCSPFIHERSKKKFHFLASNQEENNAYLRSLINDD